MRILAIMAAFFTAGCSVPFSVFNNENQNTAATIDGLNKLAEIKRSLEELNE
jgi:uncharacterized lipoprotein YajG